MKQMKQWLMVAAVVALCCMMSGCKTNERPVSGTLDNTVSVNGFLQDAPQDVFEVMKKDVIDDRFETVMDDKTTGVSVWSLIKCSDEVSCEGYGMVVAKNGVKTALPQLRHGNKQQARYDAATGDLWIMGSDTEGTGVNIERPYLFRFGEDGHANLVTSIDPYEMQETLRQMLTYSIKGQDITFHSKGKELVKVTNHIDDMGDFMDDAIYIGEQIAYDITGPLTVHVTPGVNFVTGKVLLYDDMPTFSATVTLNDDGTFTLGELKVDQ